MSQTSSEPGAPPRRHAARVLLLDDADRVLLFEGIDPWVPDVRFDATVYPTGLPRHLAELRAGSPAEPVDVGR